MSIANKHYSSILERFIHDMAFESEGVELDKRVLALGIQRVFNCPELGLYVVAELRNIEYDIREVQGKIVGCLLLSREWSDWRNKAWYWINSVYVKPEHRRKGVYSSMHQFVENLAKQHNSCGLRLYVNKDNKRAQSTYELLGMKHPDYLMYEQELTE